MEKIEIKILRRMGGIHNSKVACGSMNNLYCLASMKDLRELAPLMIAPLVWLWNRLAIQRAHNFSAY